MRALWLPYFLQLRLHIWWTGKLPHPSSPLLIPSFPSATAMAAVVALTGEEKRKGEISPMCRGGLWSENGLSSLPPPPHYFFVVVVGHLSVPVTHVLSPCHSIFSHSQYTEICQNCVPVPWEM